MEINLPSTLLWQTLFELLGGDIDLIYQRNNIKTFTERDRERNNNIETITRDVLSLCAELTVALHRPLTDCDHSHIVDLSRNEQNDDHVLELDSVGIDVFSSIRRLEVQIWDEHLPSMMYTHEACARLFHRKLVSLKKCFSLGVSNDCYLLQMTTVVHALLNTICMIKTRMKCLSDISKVLQRCRTQSIYFLQLHVSPMDAVPPLQDVNWFEVENREWNKVHTHVSPCDEARSVTLTVPTLTKSVIDNVLYGSGTFPATAAESELVAVLWMFVRDYHARPDILSRMICYNTWKMNPLVPSMGVSLAQRVRLSRLQVPLRNVNSRDDLRSVTDSLGRSSRRYFSLTSGETWVIINAFFHGEVISKLCNYSAAMKGERSMVDVRMSATPVDRLTMTVNVHQRSERHFRAQQRNNETINYQ